MTQKDGWLPVEQRRGWAEWSDLGCRFLLAHADAADKRIAELEAALSAALPMIGFEAFSLDEIDRVTKQVCKALGQSVHAVYTIRDAKPHEMGGSKVASHTLGLYQGLPKAESDGIGKLPCPRKIAARRRYDATAGRGEIAGASATRKDAEPPAGGESPMAPGADRTPEGGTCASSSPPPAALPKEAKP